MKIEITTILRGAVYLTGAAVLAVCFILLPELAREEAAENPDVVTYPYLIGAYILTLPIFVALYQAHKLAGYIDKNKAFSPEFVKTLRNIKYCASIFGLLVAIGAIAVIVLARIDNPNEEVTHIVTLGVVFTFASIVVAVATALFQRLFQNAVDIKSENDLTV